MTGNDLKEVIGRLCDRGHGDFEVVISREGEMERISTHVISSEIDIKKIKIYTEKQRKTSKG